MQLSNGTLLHGGTYRIEKTLGQGSFGITYLAVHTGLEKKVAIKEFFMKELNSRSNDGSITGMTDGSLSYNYGQKFKKEALNLSRLDHPNIVRVTDSFEENGTFYYVMDYIEGQNLNDYLEHCGVSQQIAVEIIKEVADALIYMHEQKKMLHLDLKPGNIMRRASDGHIFLIDFGLSKHYSNDGHPETSTTIGLGTAGYAPVEQSNQAKNGEFRPTIDVYALGATLYKLLTRETPPAASELVSDDTIISESLTEKGISDELISFIEKAMMPSVKKRIQTIREFKNSIPSNVGMITPDTTTEETPDSTVVDDNKKDDSPAVTVVDDSDNDKTQILEDDDKTEILDDSDKTQILGGVNDAKDKAEEDTSKYETFEESHYVISYDYLQNVEETMSNASSGNASAMLAMGFMYLRGQGVEQNLDTAYSWFTRANNKGDYRARKMIAKWSKVKGKYKKDKVEIQSERSDSSDNAGINYQWIVTGVVALIIGAVAVYFQLTPSYGEKYIEALNLQEGIGVEKNEEKAFELFKELSDKGYGPATFEVMQAYRFGNGVENDSVMAESYKTKTVEQLHKYAEKGDMYAEYCLGQIYEYGYCVKESEAEAESWYRKSAEKGYAAAQCRYGLCHLWNSDTEGNGLNKEDASIVFTELKKSAEQNYPQGQFWLAECYGQGIGTPIDSAQWINWIKKAADNNEPNALREIGNCFLNGVKVPKDEKKGFNYLKKSTDMGNPSAGMDLAYCYFMGIGTTKNVDEAIRVILPVAENIGDDSAQWALYRMYLEKNDIKTAIKWCTLAAEQDNPYAQYELAVLYQQGIGVKTNHKVAEQWYKKAIANGYKE